MLTLTTQPVLAVQYENNITTSTGTTLSYGINAEAEGDFTQEIPVDIWFNVKHLISSIVRMTISGTFFIAIDTPVGYVQYDQRFEKNDISEPGEFNETLTFRIRNFEAEFKRGKDLKGALSYSLTVFENNNAGKLFTYNVSNKAFRLSMKRTGEQVISFVEEQKNKIALHSYIPLMALGIVVLLRKRHPN